MKKERNARKDEQLRANRLQSELQYQADQRTDNALQRENAVLRRAVADLEARVIAQRDTLEAREVSLRRALQLASAHDPHKEEFFNPSAQPLFLGQNQFLVFSRER